MDTSSQERSPRSALRDQGVEGRSSSGIHWPRAYDLIMLVLTRGRRRAYHGAVLDRVGLGAGDRLLDVGCGTGTQAIAAARRVRPIGSVAGVDVSAAMIAAARRKSRRAGLEIPFERADAAELPFEEESFDAVTMTTVMHMVPEGGRRRCLLEARRVLKPGGRLLLADYGGKPDQRPGWVSRHGRHGRFDLNELREPLADAGFSDLSYGPLGWLGLYFLRGTRVAAVQ